MKNWLAVYASVKMSKACRGMFAVNMTSSLCDFHHFKARFIFDHNQKWAAKRKFLNKYAHCFDAVFVISNYHEKCEYINDKNSRNRKRK